MSGFAVGQLVTRIADSRRLAGTVKNALAETYIAAYQTWAAHWLNQFDEDAICALEYGKQFCLL